MKHLSTYLTEAQDALFHFTNGANLARILKADKFTASLNDGYSPPGYKYYMSTTRQQFAGTGYPAGMVGSDIVKLCLDGKALGSTYKIQSIDWGRAKRQAIKGDWPLGPENWEQYKSERMKQVNVESEDRVLLKTEHIPQFHKYIKKIVINHETIDAKDADNIMYWADNRGIEVVVTQTTKEFLITH